MTLYIIYDMIHKTVRRDSSARRLANTVIRDGLHGMSTIRFDVNASVDSSRRIEAVSHKPSRLTAPQVNIMN